jgi:NAD(P)-dependent dehydrogenase (short-subunit alcohol dehydrogenase family)
MTSLAVIGAGPGIGAAVARRCSVPRDRVTLLSRDQGKLAHLVEELTRSGRTVEALGADVADESALHGALDRIEASGAPDLVVYNAGLIRRDRPGELSYDEHAYAWSVNVVGAVTVAARLLPLMSERGTGSFLLTGGMPLASPDWTSLSLGKAGLRALASLLAGEYTDRGVHVAIVVVDGAVAAGTPLDPDLIAREYLRIHQQQRAAWEHDVVLGPRGVR